MDYREKIIENIINSSSDSSSQKIKNNIERIWAAKSLNDNQATLISSLMHFIGAENLNRGGLLEMILKRPGVGPGHLEIFRHITRRARRSAGMFEIDPLIDLLKTDEITDIQVEVIETLYDNMSPNNEIDENVAICWVIANSDISRNHADLLEYVATHGSRLNNVYEMKAIINLLKAPVVTDIQKDVLITIFNHSRFNHHLNEDWIFEQTLKYPNMTENHARLLKILVNEGKVYNGLDEGAAFFRVLKTPEISALQAEVLETVVYNANMGDLDEDFAFKTTLKQKNITGNQTKLLEKVATFNDNKNRFDENKAFEKICNAQGINDETMEKCIDYLDKIKKEDPNNSTEKFLELF